MNNQLEAQAVFTHEEEATYWTGEWAQQLREKSSKDKGPNTLLEAI